MSSSSIDITVSVRIHVCWTFPCISQHLCGSIMCLYPRLCVSVLRAATWPPPLWCFPGFPALCVFPGCPQISCGVFKCTGQHGFPQLFQPGHATATENCCLSRGNYSTHPSHLSHEPNEGAFDRLRLTHIYFFTTNQVVNSLPCWRWSGILNTCLFTHTCADAHHTHMHGRTHKSHTMTLGETIHIRRKAHCHVSKFCHLLPIT